jgi:hypothetical protein
MKIAAMPIGADEPVKNLNSYYSELEKVPGWQTLLAEHSRKTKEARIAARRERKLNRKGQLAA